MLFNSPAFLAFFVLVFGVYYALEKKGWQVFVLLLASAIFYAWNQPQLLILLSLSVLFNACVSRLVGIAPRRAQRIALAAFGVCINVALLVLFKYTGMLVHMFDHLLHTDLATRRTFEILIQLPLPIGISFYTFEGISLLVDTLRADRSIDQRKPMRLLRDVALFVAFFPHLIAGPIVRPSQFLPQIEVKFFRRIDWRFVGENLIIGYFLKVFVADNLGDFVDSAFALNSVLSGMTSFMAMITYAIRLFGDYAGYSYIAVGLAAALGYRLPVNFNWPFCSQSFSELWRRWNITLGAWLRDYLYIPLGGNRLGKARTLLNLMLVMLVAGIWHGAAFRFAVFGALMGLLLFVERMCGWHNRQAKSPVVQLFVTLSVGLLFSMSVLLIAMPVPEAIAYLQNIGSNWQLPTLPSAFLVPLVFAGPVVILHVLVALRERGAPLSLRVPLSRSLIRECALAVMLFFVLTNPGSPKSFVYFQF